MKTTNFIPSPLRPWAIAQLCLAFSFLTALFLSPFTDETMHQKKASLLYQSLHEHHLWDSLEAYQQSNIERKHETMLSSRQSFSEKTKDGIEIVVRKAPFFLRIWLLTSVVISVALLLKVEGAIYLIWMIPMLALSYGIETSYLKSQEDITLPKEIELIDRYMGGFLPESIAEQQIALQSAWESYLIDTWAPESNKTSDAAQFFFKNDLFLRLPKNYSYQPGTQPFILLFLFFLWNLFFASWVTLRKLHPKTLD